MTALANINFAGAQFSGTLPAAWSTLTNMINLNLNQLSLISGSLPPSWSTMTKLTHVMLSSAQLNGSLPGCVGSGAVHTPYVMLLCLQCISNTIWYNSMPCSGTYAGSGLL
jgi:hypothetical protein